MVLGLWKLCFEELDSTKFRLSTVEEMTPSALFYMSWGFNCALERYVGILGAECSVSSSFAT